MSTLSFTVASWADRDDLIAELLADDEDWGHVDYDATTGRATLTLYPRPTGGDWRFDLEAVQAILEQATCILREAAGPVVTGQNQTEERDGEQP